MPPTTFGTVFVVWSVRPGSTRSGEKARWKSTPAASPEPRSRIGQQLVAGRARVGRRLEHDEVPGAQPRADLLGRGARTIERSGSRCFESGVGSAIRIASASRSSS